ncbi:MAG: DNA-directed RNA polymerase sigma-70 factor [Saprospiraceae bacterium]|nr:MAG: DNA-directed RNA polymerase sigma-70 factor [Saprospiraceae bacterium]
MKDSQEKLLQQLRRGNAQAFEAIFRAYYQPLYYYAFRFIPNSEVAEDLTQEVFLTLWEKKEKLLISTSLKAYLYASVKNRAINYLKQQYRQPIDLLSSEQLIFLPNNPEFPDQQELFEFIQKAVKTLPEKCRIIFHLSRNNGLTYNEIAEELGITKETVKTQIKIALQKLREMLGKYWDTLVLVGWVML